MSSQHPSSSSQTTRMVFDGKRMRKAVVRRTIDFNSPLMQMFNKQSIHKYEKYYDVIQPDPNYIVNLLPPTCYLNNTSSVVATKFVHVSTNKMRCPINVIKWTPEGRRLITGASSGEFTIWNGLTFNFETILQGHEQAIRTMAWSCNGSYLLSGDHVGTIKYWQPNLNNLHVVQGHKEPVRDVSFCPSDLKFASCSDDGTIKIWDFIDAKEESCLSGHGWDVRNVQWHPYHSLLASGSKDNTIKLWDPRFSKNLATIHGYRNTISDLRWNRNGKWLLTAGKDQVIKLYDIRKLVEYQTFKGHKKEVTSVCWHSVFENVFVSGGFDGCIYYWTVGSEDNIGSMENVHESAIWSLDWHPVGHILASGSNDHTTKFWTRCRPGDLADEKEYRSISGPITKPLSSKLDQMNQDEDEEMLPGFGMADYMTNAPEPISTKIAQGKMDYFSSGVSKKQAPPSSQYRSATNNSGYRAEDSYQRENKRHR